MGVERVASEGGVASAPTGRMHSVSLPMRLKPLFLVAAPVIAAPAVASEAVDIRAVHRSTFATGSGAHAGQQSEQDSQDQLMANWGSALVVDLNDRRGADVADSYTNMTTLLGPQALGAVIDARTSTARGQREASGSAGALYQVDFDLRDTVRYVFAADVRSTRGDSGAAARISRGDATHLELVTRSGGQEHARVFGWMQPGTFRFEGHAMADARAVRGMADDEGASAAFSLRFVDAADTDLDGDVDRDDLWLFARLIATGSRHADFDGDQRLSQRDARGYMEAFMAATTTERVERRAEPQRDQRRAAQSRDGRDEQRREADRRAAQRISASRGGELLRSDDERVPGRQRATGQLRAERRGR